MFYYFMATITNNSDFNVFTGNEKFANLSATTELTNEQENTLFCK